MVAMASTQSPTAIVPVASDTSHAAPLFTARLPEASNGTAAYVAAALIAAPCNWLQQAVYRAGEVGQRDQLAVALDFVREGDTLDVQSCRSEAPA